MSQPSPDLHALLAQIRAVARGTKGVTGEEQALAAQIWAFKAEAVPFVLPLLMSPKAGVSKLAGYILRELDGVTEADLDALIAACRGGNEWVAPAIGRIGTPTAVQFLVDALLSKPERHTQTTFALGRVGEPAALAFAAVLAGPVAQPRAVARAMGEVVNAMGARGASAIDAFLDVARTPGPNQAHAVYLVGAYGEVARGAVESLRALAERHEELRRAVDQAIASIGGKDAAEVLAVELSTNPSWLGLVRLARLREKGQAAGPAVVALLASEDWEIRVCAARTLGLLGWTDGEEALRNVLAHRDDWRLVWAAADSLGRLRAQGSADLLEQVASTHWYPPVREVAARAARGESDEDASSHEFLAWERVVVPDRPMPPPWLVPDPLQLSVAELAELTIDGSLFRATTEPASSHLLTPTCVYASAEALFWAWAMASSEVASRTSREGWSASCSYRRRTPCTLTQAARLPSRGSRTRTKPRRSMEDRGWRHRRGSEGGSSYGAAGGADTVRGSLEREHLHFVHRRGRHRPRGR